MVAIGSQDKKQRPLLDVFLLALLESGFRTPFELLFYARVSTGASLPALRRLERDGLVQRGPMMARGRRDFIVTPEGQRALESQWGTMDVPYEINDVLRLIWLALHFKDVGKARNIARTALAIRRNEFEKAKLDLDMPLHVVPTTDPSQILGEFFSMHSVWETRRLTMEIEFLADLVTGFEKRTDDRPGNLE